MNARLASVYFKELELLAGNKDISRRKAYEEMYRLFNTILNEQTRQSGLCFSGPFPKMDYLCKELHYDDEAYRRVNAFRACCHRLSAKTEEELESYFRYDLKVLAEFVRDLYREPVPPALACLLPDTYRYRPRAKNADTYFRMVVERWDDQFVYGKAADGEDEVAVRYVSSGEEADFSYLAPLLSEHTQLNVVGPVQEGACYRAEQLIYEPDFLVDISTVAACFEVFGSTPLWHLLNKIKPQENRKALLLGNFAGQLLDEAIYHADEEEFSPKERYLHSVKRFFRNNALSLATCSDLDASFHQDAMQQQQNLRDMVSGVFPRIGHFDLSGILLEPSFFCEKLGIQGRMDLLQEDFRVLMEQKSGKKDFHTGGHVEKHYVQMLLYLALLHYNYGKSNQEIACYLLYSRYPDGLIKEGNAPALLAEALKIRNLIAWSEFSYAEGKAESVFEKLKPEDFRILREERNRALWEKYTYPQIQTLLAPLRRATALEKAYFYRFFTFLAREHILAKIGNSTKEASGFSAIWNSTREEKQQAGNIYDRLTIAAKHRVEEGTGIDRLTLRITGTAEDFLPNFRVGDVVVLYPYPEDTEPDARRTMVFRCSIREIRPEEIEVELRAPQKNEKVFEREGALWAIEHDFLESSFAALYRALYAFLSANPDRRALILNQRQPRIDASLRLTGDYSQGGRCPEFNELVLKAKQAQDYFLLVGPPGTGKTSYGLVNILKETLADGRSSVLLVSYTNRAVDEICSKLLREGIDFVRVGGSLSCDSRYEPYLLKNRVAGCMKTADIRNFLSGMRVFVGTTTSVSSSLSLFDIKHFDLAIVDEASQILEPHLMALLCAKHGNADAIGRFVLIGDHKQLPAVVSQSEAESAVDDPALQEIGLRNCRLSLFERWLSLQRGDERLRFTLEKQGRMHPDVAVFPNEAFYESRLRPVPLPHQCRKELMFPVHESSGLEQMLSESRMLFVASPPVERATSVKVNEGEASLIAGLVKAVWDLSRKNGRAFSSAETVGVIVPYRNQIAVIRREIDRFGIPELHDITIDTVERYQGSERDVIIYGFTVQKLYQLDFLTSNVFEENGALIDRKLNVALTRAREQMILIGNPDLLSADPTFRRLILSMEEKGCFRKFNWQK